VARIGALAIVAALVVGCGSPRAPGSRLVIRVSGAADSRMLTRDCFLLLHGHVEGGGDETYCLQTAKGKPGPRALLRDTGLLTFALPAGSIRMRVRIAARFAADGVHARQTLRGTVVGGSGRFRGSRGTVVGGGRLVERPPGYVESSRLRYVVSLR
jgi:hypothetical protein